MQPFQNLIYEKIEVQTNSSSFLPRDFIETYYEKKFKFPTQSSYVNGGILNYIYCGIFIIGIGI